MVGREFDRPRVESGEEVPREDDFSHFLKGPAAWGLESLLESKVLVGSTTPNAREIAEVARGG